MSRYASIPIRVPSTSFFRSRHLYLQSRFRDNHLMATCHYSPQALLAGTIRCEAMKTTWSTRLLTQRRRQYYKNSILVVTGRTGISPLLETGARRLEVV